MGPKDTILAEPSFAFGGITPYVDAGLAISTSSAPLLSGKRRAISLTPTVGRHLGVWHDDQSILQVYAAGRLPVQWRYSAGLSTESGYALAAEVGGRLLSCSGRGTFRNTCAGLTVALRYRYHLSEFQMDNAVMPAGSSVLSLPVSITFATRFR